MQKQKQQQQQQLSVQLQPQQRSYWTKRKTCFFFCSFVIVGLALFRLNADFSSIVRKRADNVHSLESKHSEKDALIASFPRWKDPTGISQTIILNAARASLGDTGDMYNKVYIVDDKATLLVGVVPPNRFFPVSELGRARLMESLAVRALQTIEMNSRTNNSSSRTAHLRRALQRQGGLIYIVNYADTNWCCDNEWMIKTIAPKELALLGSDNISSFNRLPVAIPVFTLSAPIDCNYTFPIPTYETIKSTRRPLILRQQMFGSVSIIWNRKRSHQKRQAIWRGSPSGAHDVTQNERKLLCDLALQHPTLLDAKLVGDNRWKDANVSHLYGDRISSWKFQNYRAVLDVDGNAWSSRFGRLLCLPSVVVKIAPRDVDYFYPELRPWQHYVPVQADMSDLVEIVQYVVADQHEDEMQQIVWNANQWCRAKFKRRALMQDMLDIWDEYARLINLAADNDPGNNDTLWREGIQELLDEYKFSKV